VAAGASHSYFGHDRWAKFALGMKTLDDARRLRSRILLAFELADQEPVDIDGDGATVSDGAGHTQRIDARTVVWAAGVQASPLASQLAAQSAVK
jgi:NADH dehydrogenase FAD-containing subunit